MGVPYVILYVEDDPESREVMSIAADLMGVSQITIFENSEDFQERVSHLKPQPNLILLDIHMGPYNGFEILKMVREHPVFCLTPVVALTASVMNEEIDQLQQAGFNGVIAKPIDIDMLSKVLDRICAGEKVWTL